MAAVASTEGIGKSGGRIKKAAARVCGMAADEPIGFQRQLPVCDRRRGGGIFYRRSRGKTAVALRKPPSASAGWRRGRLLSFGGGCQCVTGAEAAGASTEGAGRSSGCIKKAAVRVCGMAADEPIGFRRQLPVCDRRRGDGRFYRGYREKQRLQKEGRRPRLRDGGR